jgi:CubicO group peptidase (beta-lactamase class C family)
MTPFTTRKLFSFLAITALLTATVIAQKSLTAAADQAVHITHIESGLLPAVVIKGRPIAATSMTAEMARYKVPGVSVAYFDHSKILWTRTYGFADVAGKKSVTPETRFQAASISKPVAALAMLRLVQDGKLSLDEDVNVKLRGWKVPENAFTKEQKVTLRRIVSHSAGLTVHGFAGYASDGAVPSTVQVLDGEKPANSDPVRVETVPGTAWSYSGGGYVVMQMLLTEATSKSFPQLMRDLVLVPAGMNHSTYQQPLPAALRGSAATPYLSSGEPVKGGAHTYPEMAPAGLWTTPSDLAQLAIEVQNEYAGKSSKILSREMMKQMLTRQKADSGLGFGLGNDGAKLRFGHGGANEGFRCNLQAYAESGPGLAVMTNSDSGDSVAAEYLRAVAKEYNWPDFQPVERTVVEVSPAVLASYAGTYDIPKVDKITINFKDSKLFITAGPFGPEGEELFAESETKFFATSRDFTFEFLKDEQGAISGLTARAGSQSFEAKKLP